MEIISKIFEAIKSAKNIVILSHVGPDGDTLGSMLALKQMIQQFNNVEKLDTVVISRKPAVYDFLPEIELTKFAGSSDLYSNYDLAIAVDVADIDRLGEAKKLFEKAKTTINVDHHMTNNGYADINLINAKASAAGEVVYSLIEPFGTKLTKEIAINLYTAILTDTGGFKFSNTTPKSMRVAASLIEAGANPTEIYKKCYEERPLEMVKIQSWAVDNASFAEENRVAYTSVARKDLERFGASDEHLDGIAELLRQINTVEVSIVLKETTKGDTKVSMRSNQIDIGKIAGFLGGGGHKLAAGCTIHKNLKEAKNEVLPLIQKELNK